eukprot:CAMPEP_0171300776 /NCGR_PEP_ID=MMETSP0816-20121228/9702_1 /TAXON_ID=420281 /ORGANISM="Proboscia inermis, Strain CCAP1064/1" /LENGTH=110 /DNA_ID=CAMNT_0011777647 /DNA_START=201 /DNA_END=533 /DNA_ORIENTATION=+
MPVLGNLIVGDNSKIGAWSIVLSPIPRWVTTVGAPMKIIGSDMGMKEVWSIIITNIGISWLMMNYRFADLTSRIIDNQAMSRQTSISSTADEFSTSCSNRWTDDFITVIL